MGRTREYTRDKDGEKEERDRKDRDIDGRGERFEKIGEMKQGPSDRANHPTVFRLLLFVNPGGSGWDKSRLC